MRIHERLPELRDTERLDAWIFQIARNVLADSFRERQRRDALAERVAFERDGEPVDDEEPDGAAELTPCLEPMIAQLAHPLPRGDRADGAPGRHAGRGGAARGPLDLRDEVTRPARARAAQGHAAGVLRDRAGRARRRDGFRRMCASFDLPERLHGYDEHNRSQERADPGHHQARRGENGMLRRSRRVRRERLLRAGRGGQGGRRLRLRLRPRPLGDRHHRPRRAAADEGPPALPVAVIGAGPVGLSAAVQLLDRNIDVVVIEAATQVAASLRDWGHVRLFSPWRYNVDKTAVRMLEAAGWASPPPDDLPTGDELSWQLPPAARRPPCPARSDPPRPPGAQHQPPARRQDAHRRARRGPVRGADEQRRRPDARSSWRAR